jgi:hypothetical protein
LPQGNGTSVLIFAGIASSLPASVGALLAQNASDEPANIAVYAAAFFLTTLGIIYVQVGRGLGCGQAGRLLVSRLNLVGVMVALRGQPGIQGRISGRQLCAVATAEDVPQHAPPLSTTLITPEPTISAHRTPPNQTHGTLQEAERRIPINYSGRYQAGALARQSYLPFKVNATGVMPLIFASSLLGLPLALARFTDSTALDGVANAVGPGGALYLPASVAMIAFFNYYYTFLQVCIF